MRKRLMSVTVGLAVATGTVVFTAQQAGASQEFSLVARQTNFELFGASGLGTTEPQAPPAIGDRFILREDLLRGTAVVGFDNIICTVTFNDNLLCDAMFSFAGKGDIHATALLRGGASEQGATVFDATIDGGTYAYSNARGMVHLSQVGNSDTDTRDVFLIN
jgi:hypothetical protein